jgi:peptide/nickel transport system permease protein
MWKYIIKRILIAVPVLIGITVIEYFLMSLAGSPLDMIQGAHVSQAALSVKSAQLGLNRPVIVQYFTWLSQILTGNFGYSIKNNDAVSAMIGSHIGQTLLLMGVSLLISMLISVPAGVFSATHKNKVGDYSLMGLSFLGNSIPSFFLAMLLIYIFTIKLNLLPSGGMTTLGANLGNGDVVAHMIMPVIVLAVSMTGTNIRYIRSAVLEILQQDYLRTARAKGIGHFKVINKHALRNAMVSVITVFGMEIPTLFGGAIIVEQVFSWPGLGLMTMTAIINRDYPVIMGVSLVAALVVLLGNLLTDILYAVVDPTIQYH